MAVLVIGGAGYIGSHMVERLLEEGERLSSATTSQSAFEVPSDAELRAGDPPVLAANVRKIEREYALQCAELDFETIIESGWRWQLKKIKPGMVEKRGHSHAGKA